MNRVENQEVHNELDMIVLNEKTYDYIFNRRLTNVSAKFILHDGTNCIYTQEKEENVTYSFLGGRCKENESIVDCAIRELNEETRAILTKLEFIRIKNFITDPRNRQCILWSKAHKHNPFYYYFIVDIRRVSNRTLYDLVDAFDAKEISHLDEDFTEIYSLRVDKLEKIVTPEFLSRNRRFLLSTVKLDGVNHEFLDYMKLIKQTKTNTFHGTKRFLQKDLKNSAKFPTPSK